VDRRVPGQHPRAGAWGRGRFVLNADGGSGTVTRCTAFQPASTLCFPTASHEAGRRRICAGRSPRWQPAMVYVR